LKLPIAAHVIKDELRNATKHRGFFSLQWGFWWNIS